MEIKKQISLEVVHPNACGIDIGSRSHWAAVGQNAEDVKEFGVVCLQKKVDFSLNSVFGFQI